MTRCLLSGAPTPYFRGSRIKTEHRREITEENHRREIKGATRDADQRRSKDQSRGTSTAPRHIRGSEYIVKRDCSDE
jgi:hypothetical protein